MPWGRAGERTGSLAAAVIFTGFLLPGLVSGLAAVEPDGRRAAAVVVAGAYLAVGIRAVAAVGESRGAARWGAAYGTLALGAVLVLLLGMSTSWLLVSALTVVAALRPWWETAAVTVATVVIVTAGTSWRPSAPVTR